MNELFYWIIEYFKVLTAFGLVFFVWPLVVFRGFLKSKSRTFKFGFCVVVMVNIINTVVVFLGLAHCLNVWVVRVLFYGVFIFFLARNLTLSKKKINAIKNVSSGTMGRKTFIKKTFASFRRRAKYTAKNIAKNFEGHIFEYIVLIVSVMYAMLYFSWNAFQSYSYGALDMYVHNSWIYGLVNGEVYSAGIYPEAFHGVIYLLYALFGVRIYSILLFLAGINIAIIIVSAYLLFKELFKWRYSSILVTVLFLILDVKGAYPVVGMSRLAWSVPQEFGFPMFFLCGAFLVRYLKDIKHKSFRKIYNENLLIFMLSIAGSISIHFYVTIMAFFLCLMIAIAFVTKFIKDKSFAKIAIAVALGLFIAALPMIISFAGGKKFQGSLKWALDYMKNSLMSYEREFIIEEKMAELIKLDDTANTATAAGILAPFKKSSDDALKSMARAKKKQSKIAYVYNQTYVFMFGKGRAALILVFELIGIAVWIAMKVFAIIKKKNDDETDTGRYDGYLAIVLIGIMFILLNNFHSLGFPEIFETGRLCAITQLLALGVLFIPLDLLMSFPLAELPKLAVSLTAAGVLFAETLLTVVTGNYHGYLFSWLERYDSAVKCAISITEDMDKNNFTIISPTEEIYQIIQYGYHEEIVSFLDVAKSGEPYSLPTEYVFIFVEKKPIQYHQYHFATGPKWLALEKYTEYLEDAVPNVSREPYILAGEIKEEYAKNDYGFMFNYDSYKLVGLRTIIESKLYDWCQQFNAAFPGELHTYYEDDDFVCYYFKQNPRNNFDLSFTVQ